MDLSASVRWPDFYIVGAPRCGTSFLWKALRGHPGVFMPYPKEPLFFCTDLDTGTPADRREFLDERRYHDLFAKAPAEALMGEACVFNLVSTVAASAIAAVKPRARIIICLRNPVDQIVSFHAVRTAEGQEDLPLQEALDAEKQRSEGRRLPGNAVLVPAYQYRSVARYADQVERYLAHFPTEQVLILLYDDLAADPRLWLDAVSEFLRIDGTAISDPGAVNAQWRPRWSWLSRATRSGTVIAAAKSAVPQRLHPHGRRLAQRVAHLNQRPAPAARADSALAAQLRDELRPDVERLSRIIGQDLVKRWQ